MSTSARAGAGIPAGFALVPLEPTPAMIEAICADHAPGLWPNDYGEYARGIRRSNARAGYIAMLAAAPAVSAPYLRDLLGIFTEWARQVAAREDVPWGIRSAAAGLHDDGKRTLAKAGMPAPVTAPNQTEEAIRPIDECYGDCPTNPATCPNPCKFEGRSYAEDAARYRWIRGDAGDLTDLELGELVSTKAGTELDTAIDAAMQAQAVPQHPKQIAGIGCALCGRNEAGYYCTGDCGEYQDAAAIPSPGAAQTPEQP